MKAETDNSLTRYRNRAVRDLAWACFSPPLLHTQQLADENLKVANCGLALTSKRSRQLALLDLDPAPLLEQLENTGSHRLGIYFERLWQFFLRWDEDVELLAHNLPVHDGKRTIGEFDCLYYCRQRRRHFHLELAVKFFLSQRQTSIGTGPSHWQEWIGPNTRDRLDRKIERLMSHQIQLGEHSAAQAPLQQLGVTQPHKEIEIKGRLFQAGHDPLPAPFGYNHATGLAQWWPLSRLDDRTLADTHTGYALLDKTLWLAELNNDVEATASQELGPRLQKHFSTNNRPILIASLDGDGRELARFFVTDDYWPENQDQ